VQYLYLNKYCHAVCISHMQGNFKIIYTTDLVCLDRRMSVYVRAFKCHEVNTLKCTDTKHFIVTRHLHQSIVLVYIWWEWQVKRSEPVRLIGTFKAKQHFLQ
jgi:hypothetical protein